MGWELALGLGAMFFGAVVLGTISFGLGTVAMPFLLLILLPQDAVVIVHAMIILTTGLTVMQTWRHLRLGETWPFLVAGLPPVPVGVYLLHEFNPSVLRIIVALVVLVTAVMSLFSIQLPGARRPWTAPVYGCVTTFLVTAFAVGAPLGALYAIAQDWSRDTIRGTLALYFLLAAVLAMIAVLVVGAGERDDGREHRGARRGGVAGVGGSGGDCQPDQPAGVSLRGGGGHGSGERVAAGEGRAAGGLGAEREPLKCVRRGCERPEADEEHRGSDGMMPSETNADLDQSVSMWVSRLRVLRWSAMAAATVAVA